MLTLLITIVPSIAILSYFIISDKFREPKKIIIITFLFGILICLPAGGLNHFILQTFENESEINNALLGGFFAGGLVEETLKFLVLYLYVLKEKAFNEPMDAIVYGVVVSLGFATLENFYYVYLLADYYQTSSMSLAVARSFSAVPAHAVFGVFMGYFFMKYVFVKKGDNLLFAFTIPFVLHGCYNLFTVSNFYISLGLILISWIIALRMFAGLKEIQKSKRREYEKKI